MAFGAKRIYPIDLNARKAVGISLPFNANAVFKPTYTTKDAIRNNLINLLLTGQGERIFSPNLGAGIQKFVFEQSNQNSVAEIQNYIESVITKYFPNIQAVVELAASSDYNTFFITITYSIVDTGINDTIQLNINNG